MFEWNDAWLIGIDDIDTQHKELVRLLNRLEVSLEHGVLTTETRKALEFMSRYAQTHFDAEERLMIESEYPEYAIHAIEHLTFLAYQISFAAAIKCSDQNTAQRIVQFLKTWILKHIVAEDMALGQWLKLHHPTAK